MTSWNTTPFSTFAQNPEERSDAPGVQPPAVGAALQGRPLPQPARPGPLGFVDVRVEASATDDSADEPLESDLSPDEDTVGSAEIEPEPEPEAQVFEEPEPVFAEAPPQQFGPEPEPAGSQATARP